MSALLTWPASARWLAYIFTAMTSIIDSAIPGFRFGRALGLPCFFAFAFALTTRLSEGQLFWTLLLALPDSVQHRRLDSFHR